MISFELPTNYSSIKPFFNRSSGSGKNAMIIPLPSTMYRLQHQTTSTPQDSIEEVLPNLTISENGRSLSEDEEEDIEILISKDVL